MRTALIIPTRNAGSHLDCLLPALASQTLRIDDWLVVDTESTDDTAERCRAAGARVHVIRQAEFNHGGTRRWASEHVDADVLIFLTQDAIPAEPDSLQKLRDSLLSDEHYGLAYGRQMPRPDAGVLSRHAREFNYPAVSRTKTFDDARYLGIKTCFCSDAFCAYRRTALTEAGGFPRDVIGTEDAYVAGAMLRKGWWVRYESDATVYHSHNYSFWQEFKRNFDIGVFYGRERWIGETFGRAEGEGLRFIRSEVRTVVDLGKYWLLPVIFVRSLCKLAGYRMGKLEKYLPVAVKRHISMYAGYWK